MRTLLIVDDLQTRLAVQFLLSYQPDVTIVGAIGGHSDPCGIVNGLRPDVVLVDWDLQHIDGRELLQSIRRASHPCSVIVVCSRAEAEASAMAAGADVVAFKGESPDGLLASFRKLAGKSSDENSKRMRDDN